MNETGFLIINKEKNYTSHDVVAIVRKTLSGVKTGHTGTLDPQAEGVLPICLGKATKFADRVTADDKAYTAEVLLGITTDTGDATGAILNQKQTNFDIVKIKETLMLFEGEYLQTPPMYSAIKMNGKKLYELARQGITVERAARPVRIDQITMTAFDEGKQSFFIEVSCSKGTYIRSLCSDIGERLGCGACMGALTRTRSGMFTLSQAVTLDIFKQAAGEGRLDDYLWPLEKVFPYTHAVLKPEGVKPAVNGNRLPSHLVTAPPLVRGEAVWVYDAGTAVGLFRMGAGELIPEVMLV